MLQELEHLPRPGVCPLPPTTTTTTSPVPSCLPRQCPLAAQAWKTWPQPEFKGSHLCPSCTPDPRPWQPLGCPPSPPLHPPFFSPSLWLQPEHICLATPRTMSRYSWGYDEHNGEVLEAFGWVWGQGGWKGGSEPLRVQTLQTASCQSSPCKKLFQFLFKGVALWAGGRKQRGGLIWRRSKAVCVCAVLMVPGSNRCLVSLVKI